MPVMIARKVTSVADPDSGTRFGELTLVGEADPRHTGERQAELLCDCGRTALRTFNYLKNMPKGRAPACLQCLAEWRRGSLEQRNFFRKLKLLDQWHNTKSLYSEAWEEQELAELRNTIDCAAEPVLVSVPEQDAAFWPESRQPGHGQYVLPIEGEAGWACAICQKAFTEGFGCLECVDVFCAGCVGKHTANANGLTLREVGRHLGCSPERIRQIAEKALRKMRHASRAHQLDPYVVARRIPTPNLQAAQNDSPFGVCCATDLRLGEDRTFVYCQHCGKTRDLCDRHDYQARSVLESLLASFEEEEAAKR